MARKRRKFTKEFKAEAVALVLDKGLTFAQVTRGLDLTESSLRHWVAQPRPTEAARRPTC